RLRYPRTQDLFQGGPIDIDRLELDSRHRPADLDQPRQIGGCAEHDGVTFHAIDALLELLELSFAIPKGRKNVRQIGEFVVGCPYRTNRGRPRIHEGSLDALGGHRSSTRRELPVHYGGSILDDEHPLAS